MQYMKHIYLEYTMKDETTYRNLWQEHNDLFLLPLT